MSDAAMEVLRFAKLFDHSIVRPNATRGEVARSAETATRLGTASLTVQPHYVRVTAGPLRDSGVLVGMVVGFPHGNETPSMKQHQAREVLGLGAEEIDMVMNIPALKDGERELFIQDVRARVSGIVAGST
jgi:deoxyribose-phosphate aldolase